MVQWRHLLLLLRGLLIVRQMEIDQKMNNSQIAAATAGTPAVVPLVLTETGPTVVAEGTVTATTGASVKYLVRYDSTRTVLKDPRIGVTAATVPVPMTRSVLVPVTGTEETAVGGASLKRDENS